MNIVIYARYSSHNQTEQSIEGQLKECYAYAKRNNYNVIGEYIDRAMSGTNDDRPNFLKMIEDSAKNTFQGVLVYQLDRFARNRYDSAIYKRTLKKNGVRVFSARENINDDASGVLMESVLEGMAEYFSVELAQKVKRGMKINADNFYYNGGTVPLGFKLEEVNSNIIDSNGRIVKKKKYIIDEEKAPIIRKIFDMYNDGYLMADIIRYLNENDIKTITGNDFNKNSIRNILINKKYIGTYSYNGEETPNAIPRIVDNEVFDMAQEIMLKNKKAPARAKANNNYLLTTKLFCGHCKEMMTGTSGTSKTGKLHCYYQCNGVKNKNGCSKKKVKKDEIEDIVVDFARKSLTNENIAEISKTIVNVINKEKETSNLKKLNKDIKLLEKQKVNLLDSLKMCEIDSVKQSIFEELENLNKQIQKVKNEIAVEESLHINITVSQVKFFLKHLRDGKINDEKYHKMLINVLINKVYLYDDRVTIVFNTQDKKVNIDLSLENDIESSLLGKTALPF